MHPERLILVGFCAADGCIYRGKSGQSTLHIRLCKGDTQVLEAFNSMLARGTRGIYEGKRSKVISFPSDIIAGDLAKFGIVPRKTATMTWPAVSQEEARRFLLGYYYGDGCFHRYHNRDVIHFVCTKAFASGLCQLIYGHGLANHCVVSPLKRHPGYVQVVFQGKNADQLGTWLFQNIEIPLLPRKHPPYATLWRPGCSFSP